MPNSRPIQCLSGEEFAQGFTQWDGQNLDRYMDAPLHTFIGIEALKFLFLLKARLASSLTCLCIG